MLYHIGYVSTQTRPMGSEDLVELLQRALERNQELELTGILLHRKDSFFQILEGEEDVVRQMFATIEVDSRHERIEVMFEGPLEAREFKDWRMGFLELDDVDVESIPGFSDFLFNDAEPRRFLEELTHAKRLSLLFRAMR